MVEIWERSRSRFQSRTSTPSMQDVAVVYIIDAVDQLDQRALARAGLADDRHGLARLDAKGDIVQHRLGPKAEGDVVEDHLALHVLAVACPVFVQLRLFTHELENALGPGQPQLHQREGKDRDEGREAQDAHEAHVGDQIADIDLTLREEPIAVGKGCRQGKGKKEQGKIARLDLPFLDIVVAYNRRLLRQTCASLGPPAPST